MQDAQQVRIDDEEIIHTIQQGDAEQSTSALGVLYHRYVGDVWRFIKSKIHHADDADDLTSLVWVFVLDEIHSYEIRSGATVKSWLFRVANFVVLSYWRDQKHNTTSLEEWDDQGAVVAQHLLQQLGWCDGEEVESDETHETQRQADRLLFEALEDCPEIQMQILLLRYFEGLSTFEEIAQRLTLNISTVRVYHKRGLARIRAFLKKRGYRLQ